MKVFYEGVLDRVIEKGFDDKKTGERVEYKEVYFYTKEESGDEAMLIVNTQGDYASLTGKACVLGLEIDATGKRKPKLVSIELK